MKLYQIICRETGTVIEDNLSLIDAEELLCEFEQKDIYNDVYEENFYQITLMPDHDLPK